MNLRTPLGRALGSGSAKEGTEHWWMQRVTAAGLIILGTWFLLALLRLPDFSHAGVVLWASRPINGIMLLLLCGALAWHSKLGVQVVIEDYVHAPFLKLTSLILNKFVHVFVLAAAVYAILKIALRGSV